MMTLTNAGSAEISELILRVQLEFEARHGYRLAGGSELGALPPVPSAILPGPTLAKKTSDGLAVLRFGHRHFLFQPAQLWAEGLLVAGAGSELAKNRDLDLLPSMLTKQMEIAEERKRTLKLKDMARALVRVSYIDVAGALKALRGFGIRTADDLGSVTDAGAFDLFPLVAAMPSPETNQITLLGAQRAEKGPFELSLTPSVATQLPGVVNTAPSSQLVVFYHPGYPEQLAHVREVLRDYIDRPDRQIFVEGMVLEINEEGLKELGIEWQFKEGNFEWIAGTLSGGALPAATSQFGFNNLGNFDKNWIVRLKALVRDQKAEVLSRPSVLTVNNRQASIRVGTDIPIATSQLDPGSVVSAGSIAFNFKYIATGISLNIMPRANEAGDEVSLLVDTIVSSEVPGADLELRSAAGALLARAPTMATRRIQTYARIQNNTPFIIGGLVNKEITTVHNRIPLLGNIPYLGFLFRSKEARSHQREVIIVLTPHVLEPEAAASAARALPKDDSRFDSFGNELFRDGYRIRSEDVFDLAFISDSPRLKNAQREAREAVHRDPRLAVLEPYKALSENGIPGESALVHRMIYDVVRRLSTEAGKPNQKWLDANVNPERLLLFEPEQSASGRPVQFLESLIPKLTGAKDLSSFLKTNQGKALVIIFRGQDPGASRDSAHTPSPEFRLIDCPDHQQSWSELVAVWNQPDTNGVPRDSIVLRDSSDLVRLQRSIIVKKIILLNGGNDAMLLSKFRPGRVLTMPEKKSDQYHPLDGTVARLFYHSERYYQATIDAMEKALKQLKADSGGQ